MEIVNSTYKINIEQETLKYLDLKIGLPNPKIGFSDKISDFALGFLTFCLDCCGRQRH